MGTNFFSPESWFLEDAAKNSETIYVDNYDIYIPLFSLNRALISPRSLLRENKRNETRFKRRKKTCQKLSRLFVGVLGNIGGRWKETAYIISPRTMHKNVSPQLIPPHWQVPVAFTRRCTRLRVASWWIQMHLQVDIDLRLW